MGMIKHFGSGDEDEDGGFIGFDSKKFIRRKVSPPIDVSDITDKILATAKSVNEVKVISTSNVARANSPGVKFPAARAKTRDKSPLLATVLDELEHHGVEWTCATYDGASIVDVCIKEYGWIKLPVNTSSPVDLLNEVLKLGDQINRSIDSVLEDTITLDEYNTRILDQGIDKSS